MNRKPRKGEHTCRCGAYRFQHRFGGGRCSGIWIVEEQWNNHFGSGDCKHCNCLNEDNGIPYCEVEAGQESAQECPVWKEFVRFNEIKVKS